MALIRFISAFSFITLLLLLLLLFSQSRPISAGGDGGGNGVVLIPFRRELLSQRPAVKAGKKVVADELAGDDPTPDLTGKLRIHVRKVRGGGPAGVATRARGKTSSSAVRTQLSSFHFASVLGCSLLLFSAFLL